MSKNLLTRFLTIFSFTLMLATGFFLFKDISKVEAESASFTATDDAYISQTATTTNYGSATALYNDNSTGVVKKTFLKFTVADIPTGATINNVTLRMTATNSSGATINAKQMSDNSWSESTITWANAPGYGSVIANSSSVAAGDVDINVTSYVTGNGTYSIALTQSNAVQTDWSSKEGSDAPELIVSYTLPAVSSPVTLNPTDDAYVSQSASTTNYGSDAAMYNDNTTSNIKRSWLKFTIPQLPEGAIISSANLRLQATNSSGATVNVKGSTNTSWTESTITWSNAPSYNSTVISNGKPSITAGPIDFDVTSYATASGTYTFVITQANAVQTDWSSKEGSTAPQLIIDYYVPSRTSPAAFQPTDDAYVYQGATSTNYGADSSLVNNNTSGSVKRSWLKFTIDNLPLHARITNATLRLHATNSSGVTANVKGSTNTTWSEDSLTWSNAPSYNSTAISNGNQSVTAGPIDFDVTSYATESGTYTFVITQASTTETTWSSKEGSTSPELIITFTTIPDYGHDTVIAAVGDIACDPSDPNYNNGLGQNGECRQAAVADVVTDINPDRLLLLGDIQYNCGGLSAYEDVFDVSWGQFLPITSPISGNHERNATNGTDCDATSKAYGYRHYFQDAYHPPPIGANAGLWYSFDLPDNWHVVALDSDCSRSPNPCLSTGPQLAWLHEDLQEATASGKHVMAFWHHPRFSQGTHFDDDRQGVWWDALYSAGADLILNGHAHNYQEFGPVDPTGAADATNGIRQFIVGTGGKDTQGASNSTPSAATSSLIQKETTTHGALKLILHANSYEWQYIAVDGDTTNMASGSANTKATY